MTHDLARLTFEMCKYRLMTFSLLKNTGFIFYGRDTHFGFFGSEMGKT